MTAAPRLRRWVVAVTAAEALGFLVPAAVGVATQGSFAPTVLAGAVEGALLGVGQVLGAGGRVLPPGPWVAATAAGAAVAWVLGMLPSTLSLSLTDPAALVLAVAGGAVLLTAMPVLQWWATGFRRGLGAWVPVSAGAWLIGILWTFAPMPLIDERTPLPVLVAVYAVAGVLMAATVALLTGLGVRRLPGFRLPPAPAGGDEVPYSPRPRAGTVRAPFDASGNGSRGET